MFRKIRNLVFGLVIALPFLFTAENKADAGGSVYYTSAYYPTTYYYGSSPYWGGYSGGWNTYYGSPNWGSSYYRGGYSTYGGSGYHHGGYSPYWGGRGAHYGTPNFGYWDSPWRSGGRVFVGPFNFRVR